MQYCWKVTFVVYVEISLYLMLFFIFKDYNNALIQVYNYKVESDVSVEYLCSKCLYTQVIVQILRVSWVVINVCLHNYTGEFCHFDLRLEASQYIFFMKLKQILVQLGAANLVLWARAALHNFGLYGYYHTASLALRRLTGCFILVRSAMFDATFNLGTRVELERWKFED